MKRAERPITMRANVPLAALALCASLVALPTAVAECDDLSRSVSAAGTTATATLSECSSSYTSGPYSYLATQNQTRVDVTGAPLGLEAHALVDESSYNDHHPSGGYAMDARTLRVTLGSASDPVLVADASAFDHAWHTSSACWGETRASVYLYTDATGTTYLLQSVPSGDLGDGVLACDWNDAILA